MFSQESLHPVHRASESAQLRAAAHIGARRRAMTSALANDKNGLSCTYFVTRATARGPRRVEGGSRRRDRTG